MNKKVKISLILFSSLLLVGSIVAPIAFHFVKNSANHSQIENTPENGDNNGNSNESIYSA